MDSDEVLPVGGKGHRRPADHHGPPSSIRGKIGGDGLPIRPQKDEQLCRLGLRRRRKPDEARHGRPRGKFEISRLPPGVVKLSLRRSRATRRPRSAGPSNSSRGKRRELPPHRLKRLPAFRVSGRLLASPTLSKLDGLKIRLDLKEWEPMVATDAQGQFVLPKSGVGQASLDRLSALQLADRSRRWTRRHRSEGWRSSDVQLPLETLAVVPCGSSIRRASRWKGISAAAWWTENHSGVFTEGNEVRQGRPGDTVPLSGPAAIRRRRSTGRASTASKDTRSSGSSPGRFQGTGSVYGAG